MACSVCGENVPLIPSSEDPSLVTCVNCRGSFAWNSNRVDARHSGSSPSEPPPIVATDDDWDEIFAPAQATSIARGPGDRASTNRSVPASKSQAPAPRKPSPRKPTTVTLFWHWLLLVLGLGTFTCGAALVGWSFTEERAGLWHLGAPLALVGQLIFLIGLFLQLDVLWLQGKQNGEQIEQLGTVFGAPREESIESRASLAHGVESPEQVLSDLKSRLDLVGTRLRRS